MSTVITNENAADFYAQKLGLAVEESAVEAVAEEAETEPTQEETSQS